MSAYEREIQICAGGALVQRAVDARRARLYWHRWPAHAPEANGSPTRPMVRRFCCATTDIPRQGVRYGLLDYYRGHGW